VSGFAVCTERWEEVGRVELFSKNLLNIKDKNFQKKFFVSILILKIRIFVGNLKKNQNLTH
jgi:hypothetical protein